jgi:hypothetical protein
MRQFPVLCLMSRSSLIFSYVSTNENSLITEIYAWVSYLKLIHSEMDFQSMLIKNFGMNTGFEAEFQ